MSPGGLVGGLLLLYTWTWLGKDQLQSISPSREMETRNVEERNWQLPHYPTYNDNDDDDSMSRTGFAVRSGKYHQPFGPSLCRRRLFLLRKDGNDISRTFTFPPTLLLYKWKIGNVISQSPETAHVWTYPRTPAAVPTYGHTHKSYISGTWLRWNELRYSFVGDHQPEVLLQERQAQGDGELQGDTMRRR